MRISLLVLRTACLSLAFLGAIAQAQTLRVATLEWAPYVGSDLPGNGLASRILTEALALLDRPPAVTATSTAAAAQTTEPAGR